MMASANAFLTRVAIRRSLTWCERILDFDQVSSDLLLQLFPFLRCRPCRIGRAQPSNGLAGRSVSSKRLRFDKSRQKLECRNGHQSFKQGSSVHADSQAVLDHRAAITARRSKNLRGTESVGRASRPSFLFHALTGETPIPLFATRRSSSEALHATRSLPQPDSQVWESCSCSSSCSISAYLRQNGLIQGAARPSVPVRAVECATGPYKDR